MICSKCGGPPGGTGRCSKCARKTYRRMTEFRIDEISAVDRPAQEGARATIIKRAAPATTKADATGAAALGAVLRAAWPPDRFKRAELLGQLEAATLLPRGQVLEVLRGERMPTRAQTVEIVSTMNAAGGQLAEHEILAAGGFDADPNKTTKAAKGRGGDQVDHATAKALRAENARLKRLLDGGSGGRTAYQKAVDRTALKYSAAGDPLYDAALARRRAAKADPNPARDAEAMLEAETVAKMERAEAAGQRLDYATAYTRALDDAPREVLEAVMIRPADWNGDPAATGAATYERARREAEASAPVQKANAADAEIQRLADRLRKADGALTPAQAYVRALELPDGQAAYDRAHGGAAA